MKDNSIISKAFGVVLKELRLERGFTQEQLADLAMLNDRSHVSMIERGQKVPMLPTVFSLAEAMGISASELIRLVESKLI
jgi:transcriptional regulator with XRE-family HTH domain